MRYSVPADTGITMESFRRDPQKSLLKTPSGKIEIYSERLAERAKKEPLPEGIGQKITHPLLCCFP